MTIINRSDYPDWVFDGLQKLATSEEELLDLLYDFDERCGIMHYDGNVDMKTAEREAFKFVSQQVHDRKKV